MAILCLCIGLVDLAAALAMLATGAPGTAVLISVKGAAVALAGGVLLAWRGQGNT
jgi:hypothetical protein